MIRKALLAAAVLAALAACKPAPDKAAPGTASGTPPGSAPGSPPPATATAQGGGDWFLTIDPAGNMLDFKASETAAADLNLTCKPGAGVLSMNWGNAQPATLSSGAASQTYAAAAASAGLNDPVFAALRDSGEIEITQVGTKKILRGTPDGRFAVRAFFQFCNKPVQ